MAGPIATECLNQIFLEARTHNKWQDKPVPDELLVRLVDIMKMGPTSANQSPARILFVKSAEAKTAPRPASIGGKSREDHERARLRDHRLRSQVL